MNLYQLFSLTFLIISSTLLADPFPQKYDIKTHALKKVCFNWKVTLDAEEGTSNGIIPVCLDLSKSFRLDLNHLADCSFFRGTGNGYMCSAAGDQEGSSLPIHTRNLDLKTNLATNILIYRPSMDPPFLSIGGYLEIHDDVVKLMEDIVRENSDVLPKKLKKIRLYSGSDQFYVSIGMGVDASGRVKGNGYFGPAKLRGIGTDYHGNSYALTVEQQFKSVTFQPY